MALNFHENPAWIAAVAKEREIREAAYLGLLTPIAPGIELAPLTLRQQMVLYAIKSPLVSGAPCEPVDAAVFLWVCHPDYSPRNVAARDAYLAHLQSLPLDWPAVIENLKAFFTDASLDSPRPSKANAADCQAPATCGASVYVSIMYEASCGGMSRDEILDSPVVCLNQERRNHLMKQPKHGVLGGKLSNAAEKECVLAKRAQKQAEQEALKAH